MKCTECGLNYVEASEDDRRTHRLYHSGSVDGLKRRPLPSDIVVWTAESKRILVVTRLSNRIQRRRAEDLGLVAQRDIPFSFIMHHADEPLDERQLLIFIGAESDRLVAYLAFEKREHIGHCTWPQWDAQQVEEIPGHAPMWSVGAVWVCHKKRRQGWVRQLLAAATKYVGVPPDEYGWYTPFSESGEAAARAICPQGFFIAK
jgi:hypothetical protein